MFITVHPENQHQEVMPDKMFWWLVYRAGHNVNRYAQNVCSEWFHLSAAELK